MALTESFSVFSSPSLFGLCVNGSALNVLIRRLLPQHRLRLTITFFGQIFDDLWENVSAHFVKSLTGTDRGNIEV